MKQIILNLDEIAEKLLLTEFVDLQAITNYCQNILNVKVNKIKEDTIIELQNLTIEEENDLINNATLETAAEKIAEEN